MICLKYSTLLGKSNDGIRFRVHSAKIKWFGFESVTPIENDQNLVLFPQIFLIFRGLLKYVKGINNATFWAWKDGWDGSWISQAV